MTTLLLIHAAATCAMAGLIWFVQVVHYPLFGLASARRFTAFSAEHVRRTGIVVVPLMIVEAGTAVTLLFSNGTAPGRLPILGAVLLATNWISTATLQVPLHRHLSKGFDPAAHRRLVRTNWIRTLAWTGRGIIALLMLAGGPTTLSTPSQDIEAPEAAVLDQSRVSPSTATRFTSDPET